MKGYLGYTDEALGRSQMGFPTHPAVSLLGGGLRATMSWYFRGVKEWSWEVLVYGWLRLLFLGFLVLMLVLRSAL